MISRPLYETLWHELAAEKPMVFLVGPRQSGKTTFAKKIAMPYASSLYFNWDNLEDRKRLASTPYFFQEVTRQNGAPPLIILDEIHKYNRWKNYLKGVYDGFSDRFQFLVLGSGRLNVYQKGGDSLAGRYRMLSLWPLTLAELAGHQARFADFRKHPLRPASASPAIHKLWDHLAMTSGFPEPFSIGNRAGYQRWVTSYDQQLIRQDIRDLTAIKNLDQLEMLYALLPSKVGSLLSIDNLATDLHVAFNSVSDWIEVFESFYLVFRLSPWEKSIARSLRKSQKLYFMDYARLTDPGARFENQVAVELWRAVASWNDRGWGRFKLHYVRTKDHEEVDFLLAESDKPFLLIEAKLSDDAPDRSLLKFQKNLRVPAVQVVEKQHVYKILKNEDLDLLIISAARWLSTLP